MTAAAIASPSAFQRDDLLRDVEHGDAGFVRPSGLVIEKVDLLRRLEHRRGPRDVPPPYDVVASNGTGMMTTCESSGVNGRP